MKENGLMIKEMVKDIINGLQKMFIKEIGF